MKQGVTHFNSQIVRSIRPDQLVPMRMSIDDFTDELLQENSYGATSPIESRL
jgi:hypothetical protein